MKEIEHSEQLTTYSCGAACLSIAYRALEVPRNEADIMVEIDTKKNGVEWYHLANHASSVMGFPTETKTKTTYEDLERDFKRGVIITGYTTNCNGELFPHVCVISGILKDYIELTDPGTPYEDWPTILTREEFVANWSIGTEPQSYLLIRPKK